MYTDVSQQLRLVMCLRNEQFWWFTTIVLVHLLLKHDKMCMTQRFKFRLRWNLFFASDASTFLLRKGPGKNIERFFESA